MYKTFQILISILFLATIGGIIYYTQSHGYKEEYNAVYGPAYIIPDIDKASLQALLGLDVAKHTWEYIGVSAERRTANGEAYISSNLTCTGCHVDNALKPNYGPWIVSAIKYYDGGYRKLTNRINYCITEYMRGNPLETDSSETKALTNYMKHLSTGLQSGYRWGDVKETDYPLLEPTASVLLGREYQVETIER